MVHEHHHGEMAPHEFHWRKATRIIATIDLVLNSITLVILIAVAVLVIPELFVIGVVAESTALMGLIVLIFAAVILLQFLVVYIGFKLWKATEQGKDVPFEEAAKAARVWRAGQIYIVLLSATLILRGRIAEAIVSIAVHFAMIFIVTKYINEVDAAIISPGGHIELTQDYREGFERIDEEYQTYQY